MVATGGLGRLDDATAEEYWRFIEEKRSLGDVVWDDELRAWLVFSYDRIREMGIEDDTVWRSIWIRGEDDGRMAVTDDEWVAFIGPSPRVLPLLEGAAYDAAHRWYFRALSPRVLARWSETIMAPLVHAQIDRFAAAGRAELTAELTDRIAARIATAVLGLPADDGFAERMIELHRHRTRMNENHLSVVDRALVDAAIDARREMAELVMPFVRERRSGEGDDLISMIWRDGETLFGPGFDELDVASTAAGLVGSGSGSVGAASGNGLYLLATLPGLQDELRDGGEHAIAVFAEEALRLYSPVQLRFRWAKRDTVVGDTPIARDDLVITFSGAGNRDARHYERPEAIDVGRRGARDHFGFGLGPRTCPGQSLARAELVEIYRAALDRLPGLRLDPDAPPPAYLGKVVRRWRPLHVLFDAS